MPGLADLPGVHVLRVAIPAMASASTDAEATSVVRAPFNMTVTSCTWIPSAAVTANGTDFATVSVVNRGSGAATTSVASRSYAATNSVAYTPEAMTLSATAANLSLTQNDVLTVKAVHSGSGVAVPAGVVEIQATIR